MDRPETTKILKCFCEHPYQDAKYGKGMRVHNKKGKTVGADKYVCTVCEFTRARHQGTKIIGIKTGRVGV